MGKNKPEAFKLLLYSQGSYWTMDGPAEVNLERAPKRPYPEEKEERQDVCCLESLIQLLTINHKLSKSQIRVKKPH